MTKRTDSNGHPYANDPIKIAAIADAIATHLTPQIERDAFYNSTPIEDAIAEHAEYDDLNNSMYWLAVSRAFAIMQQRAMDKFTDLVTDKDEEEFEVAA